MTKSTAPEIASLYRHKTLNHQTLIKHSAGDVTGMVRHRPICPFSNLDYADPLEDFLTEYEPDPHAPNQTATRPTLRQKFKCIESGECVFVVSATDDVVSFRLLEPYHGISDFDTRSLAASTFTDWFVPV